MSPFPSVWQRYRLTRELLEKLSVIPDGATLVEPELASLEELLMVHTPGYVSFVKEMSARGTGYLDYGDTPAYPGVFERASASAGGSILGARLIGKGEFTHAFNPGGGLHHARPDSAAGFCVFNDVALAVRTFQREFSFHRVAVLDFDGHHADGTQEIFFGEKVLTVSFHRFDPLFYPGTGSVSELGEGDGLGYSVNVPLPARTSGDLYTWAFEEIVPPLLAWYRPEVMVAQFGADGHFRDPLVRLYLTTRTYETLAGRVHELSHEFCGGRLLLLGGGGYNPDTVARCWAIVFSVVCCGGGKVDQDLLESLHDADLRNPSRDLTEEVKSSVEKLKKLLAGVHGDIFD